MIRILGSVPMCVSLKGMDRVKLRKYEYASIDDVELFAHTDPMLGEHRLG